MMKNTLALSAGFFRESSVNAWRSAREAGIREVEIGMSANLPVEKIIADTEAVYRDVTGAGLKATSIHLPFSAVWDISALSVEKRTATIGCMKQLIDWASIQQINIAVLHPSFEPIASENRYDRLKSAFHAIQELSEYSHAKKIQIAVENLPRTCLGNCIEEMEFLTNCGRTAGICMDVNHLLKDSHRDFIHRLNNAIITTHLSDYDRIDEKHWMIGKGCIDWKELFLLFNSIHYSGRFLFELSEKDPENPDVYYTPRELVHRFYIESGLTDDLKKE